MKRTVRWERRTVDFPDGERCTRCKCTIALSTEVYFLIRPGSGQQADAFCIRCQAIKDAELKRKKVRILPLKDDISRPRNNPLAPLPFQVVQGGK